MTMPQHESDDQQAMIPQSHVRLMPRHPLGGTPALSPVQLADLGAQGAALGMERSAVTGFIHDIQTLAADVAVQAAGRLLERVRRAQEARLETLAQYVKALPGAPAPGIFDSVNGKGELIRLNFVSREAVLAMIQSTMSASPRS